MVNTLRPRQNGCHFPDDIFICIFLNETLWILIQIALKFVPKVQINNIPALVQVMASCQSGNKSLSEPALARITDGGDELKHITVHWLVKLDALALTLSFCCGTSTDILTFCTELKLEFWLAGFSSCPLKTLINTSSLRQNSRHFADDIFKCIFLNENAWISIKISLKFVPESPINNVPVTVFVQIMAWHWPGDKTLSEPMMLS